MAGRQADLHGCWIWPVSSAVAAALAAADAQVPVVQPVRSACFRTFAVRGRSGSRSSGSGLTTSGCELLPGRGFGLRYRGSGRVVQVRAAARCL